MRGNVSHAVRLGFALRAHVPILKIMKMFLTSNNTADHFSAERHAPLKDVLRQIPQDIRRWLSSIILNPGVLDPVRDVQDGLHRGN